ncbi:hypothetical protein GQ44DRAFT_742971 [Phaeosphaeriaceae sp. PMI808]|nr:hypothetical protein GQ44DRAFT_742971 [Phaeosphaeriaceae sp. PMI808]
MALPEAPNWLRIFLLILSVLSFIPQFRHTIHTRNSTGISIGYALLNLISATEQFSLTFFLLVNSNDSYFFIHDPINAGDWLNFAQLTVVALLWLSLSKSLVLGIYLIFLLISIVPAMVDAITRADDKNLGKLEIKLFIAAHYVIMPWLITFFNVVALFFQATKILSLPPNQALSLKGLAAQAVIFALLGITWVSRVRFPYNDYTGVTGNFLMDWFRLVGWTVVDSIIFSIGQAVLLWIILCRVALGKKTTKGETEPLLNAQSL